MRRDLANRPAPRRAEPLLDEQDDDALSMTIPIWLWFFAAIVIAVFARGAD